VSPRIRVNPKTFLTEPQDTEASHRARPSPLLNLPMYFPVLLWSLVIFASFWSYGETLRHVSLSTARALSTRLLLKNDFAIHDFANSFFDKPGA
jgi:hypothetical protein